MAGFQVTAEAKAKTAGRAVALLPFGIVAVDLDQLSVVHILRECVRDRRQIHLVAVRGQLDSIGQTAFNVLKELRRTPGIPPSDHPGNNQLGLSLNRGKRPNVTADPGLQFLLRNVLLLAADERPYLIDLDALGCDVAD